MPMHRVVMTALGVVCVSLLAAQPAMAGPHAPPAGNAKAAPAKKPAVPDRSKKAAKSKTKTVASSKAGRKPGTERASVNPEVRASISGEDAPSPNAVSAKAPKDTGALSELDEMKQVDGLLFPSRLSGGSAPRAKLPGTSDGIGVGVDPPAPEISATGLPPEAVFESNASSAAPSTDLSWLSQLTQPDIPFRWDPRLIRYLDYFKNDPNGRAMVAGLLKRSGRYVDEIQKRLRARNMPEDIAWLALVESGMDPRISSRAGAAGLWQFMPKAAAAYGLRIDRWVDERLDPERSTDAALDYLSDLHTRFGRWELAFAAYNMGHGGLLTSIRKYNTNDYWALSGFEDGVPYETALYVPKILAIAFVSHNRAVFGCDPSNVDPAEPFVPPAKETKLASAKRPAAVAKSAPKAPDPKPAPPPSTDDASLPRKPAPPGTTELTIRWGESLEAIALDHGTTESKIRAINGLTSPVPPRPGTVIAVPDGNAKATAEPFVAVVPPGAQASMPDRKRVLYEVVWGDQLDDIARVLGVSAGELCQWNNIDPTARLHAKMILQAYVPKEQNLDDVRYVAASKANVLTAGTQAFFDFFESKNGRKRVTVTAAKGDTWATIAKKNGLSVALLERINQRSRYSKLAEGEQVVVYARSSGPAKAPPATDDTYDEASAMLDAPMPAIDGDD